MDEFDHFEIGIGEVGIHVASDGAFRQLRSVGEVRVREVLDVEPNFGYALNLHDRGSTERRENYKTADSDFIGGQLCNRCVARLEEAVLFGEPKRLELTKGMDRNLVMYDDLAQCAEDLVSRCHRGKRLMVREGFVKPSSFAVAEPTMIQFS